MEMLLIIQTILPVIELVGAAVLVVGMLVVSILSLWRKDMIILRTTSYIEILTCGIMITFFLISLACKLSQENVRYYYLPPHTYKEIRGKKMEKGNKELQKKFRRLQKERARKLKKHRDISEIDPIEITDG